MIVEFDKSFLKSINKINHQPTLDKIRKVTAVLEENTSIQEVSDVKKLTGFDSFYRIRLGDYRPGFEMISSDKVRLIIVAHRKDIYRKFP